MEEVKTKKKFDLSSYGVVVGFLCIEVLAFISFYLGHSFLLFGILSVVLGILLILVTIRQISKDGIATFAFFAFPLFVFGLLTVLSRYCYDSVGAIGVAEAVFVPFALTFISLSGFLTGYIEKFKIKTMMLVIYGALALFVLINLIITMIYYMPFYTLIYKNSYIFYDGRPSALPIGSMAYMLYGFQVAQVTVEYWSLFPSLLLTGVIPLFFIKYKDNRREFIIYAVVSGIAFLSLLFTISKITILSDIALIIGIAIIILCAKIHKTRQIFDTMMISIGVIAFIVILILFLLAQSSWSSLDGMRNTFANNRLLNKLFIGNRFASGVSSILDGLFASSSGGFIKLFGTAVGGYVGTYEVETCGIWLFDNLYSSGLFGALFFLVALVLGIRRLFKYLDKGNDEEYIRYLIAAYVLGFLVISLLLLDVAPLVNSDHLSPFFTSSSLLVTLFLLGYTYNKSLSIASVPAVKQEALEKKEEKKEEDYDEILSL